MSEWLFSGAGSPGLSWIKGHLAGCTQRCYNILGPDPHFLSQSRSRDQTFWLGLKAKILASTSIWRPEFQYQPVWAKILVLFLVSKVWSGSWSQDWSQPWFRSQRFGLKTLVSRLWSQPLSQSQRFVPGLGLKILASTLVSVWNIWSHLPSLVLCLCVVVFSSQHVPCIIRYWLGSQSLTSGQRRAGQASLAAVYRRRAQSWSAATCQC